MSLEVGGSGRVHSKQQSDLIRASFGPSFAPLLDLNKASTDQLVAHPLIGRALAKDAAHRRFPFYELGRELHLTRQGRAGLHDVMINFQDTDYDLDIAGAPSC